ncbi:unnamed protein product [Rhizophagus irregularis]|nr:unnamed protein product [Rhizophagus irregularis]CAB5215362.1 unnamed protein product [Rhizophagus irregularis]
MKQPPPPPEPSKKKQRNKWKIWKEKRQEYDDFMSKPYTYRPFSPDAYHQELFGPAHLDPYTSDDTKAVEHRPLKRDTSTNPSAPSTSLTIKRPRPADTNSSNFVRKHAGAYIYRKHLSNLKLNPSDKPAIKQKQETRLKRHCARVFKNINPSTRTMKEDELAAGRRYRFLFHESQHIYSPVHHLKFKRHSKEKILPDPDDYTFNIPHHSLNDSRLMPKVSPRPATSYRPSGDNTIPHYLDASEIAGLKGFLEPIHKPVHHIRGHNPVDPTKLNSHYYLQYDPDHPHLPPDICIRKGNRQDLDSNDANYIGTTLKHFYR